MQKHSRSLEKGQIDFFEIQSDDVTVAAQKAGADSYQIIEGALDNLATLQARNVSPEALTRLATWSRSLDRRALLAAATSTPTQNFSANRKVPARTLLALSEAEAEAVPTEAPPKNLSVHMIKLVLELGAEATSDQLRDAKALGISAATYGIEIEIKSNVPDFRSKWESEAYSLTLTRMGVTHYDEADLWNGYLCAGYKPYASLGGLACSDIKQALELPTGHDQRKKMLKSAYRKILASGHIVPLYHFPRRYLVHKRWNLVDYNVDRPYPRFSAFELTGS